MRPGAEPERSLRGSRGEMHALGERPSQHQPPQVMRAGCCLLSLRPGRVVYFPQPERTAHRAPRKATGFDTKAAETARHSEAEHRANGIFAEHPNR
eukprot:scaffold245_cov256-Pinguiococcus_pyrenoidosus.AAC.2